MDVLKTRADRVIKLLELTKTDACIVKSPENRRYLTGLATSEGMVVITKMGNRYVIVDDRYEEIAAKQLVPQGFALRVAINKYNYVDIMNDIVQSDRVSSMLLESDGISHEEYIDFENGMYSRVMPLKTQLSKIRTVKDLQEVENIKTAQRISEKTFEEILDYIKPGMSEKQVQAKIVQSLLENGSDLEKFHINCVSGPNSSLVHGVAGDRIIQKGDPIMLDFGAFYNGYRSSMARTICVGEPEEEFKKIYSIVKNASLLGARHIRNGVAAKTADEEIRGYIEQSGYGPHFVHASGHGIGIDYIEGPLLSYNSNEVLSTGNVIIMEPGIYIKGRHGVRISDLYYIGAMGTEDITRAPKELIIL